MRREKAGKQRSGRRLNSLYLVGMECCGKTSVGRELARMAGIPFVDVNEQAEKEAGMPIAGILAKEGRKGLRERAKRALLEASRGDWQDVACSAEDPLEKDCLSLMLNTGAVVFLDVPVALLLKRFDFVRYRGAIGDEEELRRLYVSRHPQYVASCGVQLKYGHAESADAAYDLLKIFYPDYFWR